MNASSSDGRTSTGSSKSGSTTKPEEIEMSASTGSHDGRTSGSASGAASTGGTTNQTGENIQMTVFASRATTTSNVSAQSSDSGGGDTAADVTFPESSGSTGSTSHAPQQAGITSIWHRISFWWTTRSTITKIAICLVLSLLFSLFMIWAIWQVFKQKDGDTTTTIVLPFTTTQESLEWPQLSSTLFPVEPIDGITTDSPIWPEFTLPPDLPTEFETISAFTKDETLPPSSQLVEVTSSTQGHFSKMTPQESSTITTQSTSAVPTKPTTTEPFTFSPIDDETFTPLDSVPTHAVTTSPPDTTPTVHTSPSTEHTTIRHELFTKTQTLPETTKPSDISTTTEEETFTTYEEITFPEESTSHVVHTSPHHELSTKPQTSPESTKPSDISTTTTKLTTEPVTETSPSTHHTSKPTEPPTTIRSPYLIKYENELSQSLNFSGDPCDNFFDFVCDNYPYPFNILGQVMSELFVTLDAAIQQERDQRNHTAKPYPIAVQMVTDIYFACLDAKQGHQPNEDVHGFKKLPKVKFECMQIVFKGHALVCYRLYVDYHSAGVNSSSYLSENVEKAKELTTFMKASFKKNIEEHITWLDDETRQRALRKLDKMSSFIGFPKMVLDDTFLNYLYRINNNYYPDYFDYFSFTWEQRNEELTEAKSAVIQRMSGIFQPYTKWATDTAIWNSDLTSANYNPVIPIHWLRLPIFDLEFPAFYNFAAMGFVLGHEMTHGFDKKGSNYDENGNWKPGRMWTSSTRAHFNHQGQCFVEQYGKLRIDDRWPTMMNGPRTMNENIADSGAFKIAYYALKSFMQSGRSVNDPFLFDHKVQELSTEQLFFIATAQSFCRKRITEETSSRDLLWFAEGDTHSPPWHRVNIPLCNFDRFVEAFKCDASSRMNCANKCFIW